MKKGKVEKNNVKKNEKNATPGKMGQETARTQGSLVKAGAKKCC